MADIYFAIGFLAVSSTLLFVVAQQICARAPNWMCDLLGLVTVEALVAYTHYLWDNIVLAELLPFSSLIILGNWFPLFAGFLAGVVWNRVPGSTNRKRGFVLALGLASMVSVLVPIRGVPPICVDNWQQGICVQTSIATCSPASAATLLKAYRIETTEQEMAELCLTRDGTRWQGLYRGLKLKTAGSEYDVKVFEASIDELKTMANVPIILILELEKGANVDPAYQKLHGWIPGVSHSAVLLSFHSDDRVIIADSANGKEVWTVDDLKVLWHGQGFILVKKS